MIITGHGKRAIEDHFDTNVDLEYHLRQHGKVAMLDMVQEISKIYEQYAALAAKEENVIFGGRLAEYKYYDMDDVIASALEMVKKYEAHS